MPSAAGEALTWLMPVVDDIDRCIQNDTVNWARVVLASELEFEPGTKFRYNSMDTYLLSAIVMMGWLPLIGMIS